MKSIAVIYHSAHGNTEHFARRVVAGAQSLPDTEVSLLKAETITNNPIPSEQHSGVPYEQALNRLGSWTGMMAQAGHSGPGQAFAPGDLRTAEAFGRNFASVLARMSVPAEETA